MKMNSRLLNEAKELEAKWAKVLPKLIEPSKGQISVLLECQRLHNETGTWDCCEDCKTRDKKEPDHDVGV